MAATKSSREGIAENISCVCVGGGGEGGRGGEEEMGPRLKKPQLSAFGSGVLMLLGYRAYMIAVGHTAR